jgi:hypothetical protein
MEEYRSSLRTTVTDVKQGIVHSQLFLNNVYIEIPKLYIPSVINSYFDVVTKMSPNLNSGMGFALTGQGSQITLNSFIFSSTVKVYGPTRFLTSPAVNGINGKLVIINTGLNYQLYFNDSLRFDYTLTPAEATEAGVDGALSGKVGFISFGYADTIMGSGGFIDGEKPQEPDYAYYDKELLWNGPYSLG